jgi:hypothetical protein
VVEDVVVLGIEDVVNFDFGNKLLELVERIGLMELLNRSLEEVVVNSLTEPVEDATVAELDLVTNIVVVGVDCLIELLVSAGVDSGTNILEVKISLGVMRFILELLVD